MKVALLRCDQYDLKMVKERIREALELIDGFRLIKKDSRVFIKLNCLGPFDKNLAITTHPVFVQAVIQLVKEKTQNIVVGDNPATKDIIPTLKKNGIYPVLVEEQVQIVNGKASVTIKSDNYKIYQSFDVSEEMVEVDAMINLPKLKTHGLAYMTCAQKNLFGLIYGLQKAGWHVKAPNPLEFAEAMNDLYGAVLAKFKDKTLIHICDGILGLEGEGPGTTGIPKQANVILASLDAISLDRVACEVVSMNPKRLFINNVGSERGLGVGDINKIEIVGATLDDFKDLKFKEPEDALNIAGLKLLKKKGFRNIILEHPKINHSLCIKCGECALICPPKALTIQSKEYPRLTLNKCIRCWCCMEVCPKEAIKKTKRPLIGRLLLKNFK